MNYLTFKKEMTDNDIKFHRNQVTAYTVMFIGSLSLVVFGSCVLLIYGLSVTLNIVLGSLIPHCIWTFTLLRMSLTDYKISKEYRLRLEERKEHNDNII
jgi:hypothetical protein